MVLEVACVVVGQFSTVPARPSRIRFTSRVGV
jgi:hypothetical protein